MTELATRDRSKLPKWAQHELERLEANVDYWQKKATAGPAGSDIFADPFHEGEGRPLGAGTRVRYRFSLEEGDRSDYVDVWLVDRLGGGRALEINAGRAIHVAPQSSNALKLVLGEWV